jgi:hypothetical protein
MYLSNIDEISGVRDSATASEDLSSLTNVRSIFRAIKLLNNVYLGEKDTEYCYHNLELIVFLG